MNYGVISPFTSFIEGEAPSLGLDEWDYISGKGDYSHEIELKNLGLPPGIYVLVLEHQGKILTRKVVIK